MAESMFDTYANGQMEVTHDGDTVIFELPEWMKEVGAIIEDEEKLVEWSKSHNNLLAIFHAAFAKIKIDWCAVVRPADIAGEKKGEKIKISLLKDAENAQKRADEFTIKPAVRPGTGGKTPEQRMNAANKLLSGLTPEQLAEVLQKAQR